MARHARRRHLRRALLALLGLSLAVMLVQLARAAQAARAGEQQVRQARELLEDRQVTAAQRRLARAHRHFNSAKSAIRHLGPLGVVARVTPLVRVQLRAARDLVDAGEAGTRAALRLSPVLAGATADGRTAEQVVRGLAEARPLVDAAVRDLDDVSRRMHDLSGYRLVWPLDNQVRASREDLDGVLDATRRAQLGLTVLLDLTGVDGLRRHLLLSQNPDEPRPTGGYIGTYGVATGEGGKLRLTAYAASSVWTKAHPKAVVPASKAPFIFGYVRQAQDLSNVNTLPHWPHAAEAAAAMWQRGGEAPLDGVLTFMPGMLVRLVGRLEPVRVPGYPDVLTAANIDERLEHYSHGPGARGKSNAERQEFIGDLAHVLLDRVLDAPTDELPDLLRAVSTGLIAGEGALWSRSAAVQTALRELGWDGSFPTAQGDFYADAEFALASKNGRALRRTFDHSVSLSADGSGASDTVMLLRNTMPYRPGINIDSSAYLTPYGPRGALLDPASDKPDGNEPPLAGHPTAGWLRAALPLGTTGLHVRWQAPELAVRRPDGSWDYRLTWLPTPGHRGDVLNLSVTLPEGARWIGAPPPQRVTLYGPFRGEWRFEMDGM